MQTKFRFNKKTIDLIPPPESRLRVYDSNVEGLILDLSPSGNKTFRVYKKIKGKASPVSVTLGKYPALSIENARNQAIDALSKLSLGINPNEASRAHKLAEKTLREVYGDYTRQKDLTPSTLRGYKSVVDLYLSSYADRPLIHITEDIVKKEHRRVTQSSPAQADLVMRFLRALFNFARYEYRGLGNKVLFDNNPVQILSHQKLWNKVARKHTRLTRTQLPGFFDGLEAVRQSGDHFAISVCDLVETALLTGLRRSELTGLIWSHVNLSEATYYIDTTKNGDPLELPLSNHLLRMFKRRYMSRSGSIYVFDAPNEHGRIVEPKKVVERIRQQSGIQFSLHDLRRTFTTIAESLALGGYTIKRLLNHRTRRDDVTAGYMVLTPEELRGPAQRIEDAILLQAEIKRAGVGLEGELLGLISEMPDKDKRELIFYLSNSKQGGSLR